MLKPDIFSGEIMTDVAFTNSQQLYRRLIRSKRVQRLKKAVHSIPRLGIWNIMPSGCYPGQFAITGDGLPIVYFKPERGLFWFKVTTFVGDGHPFGNNLRPGQRINLHNLIKAVGARDVSTSEVEA